MLLTPLMSGQALLRPHTQTTQAWLSVKPRPSIRAGSCWSWAWRRAVGPPPAQGSRRPHTLTQASPLTLSGQASVCFPFKSTTERTPTRFLNKAGITGLWKVCQTLKAYDVCVCVCDLQLCFFHFSFTAAENWSHADKHQGENKNHNVNELRDPPFWTQSA